MKQTELWTPEERLNFVDAFVKFDDKPIDLDFWQEAFLKDTSKFIGVLKSRRTGFSLSVALKGLVKATDPQRKKYVRQFVSYNEEDAKEKINYVKEFYETIPKKARKEIRSATKTGIEFVDKGGKTVSRLISIACRPPRGKGGDLVLDEMAIYPENKASTIYTAGLPVISRGGCIEIGSTPLGKIGQFYEIITNKDKFGTYTRYTIPWWFTGALCNNVPEALKMAPYMDTEDRVEVFGSEILKTIFNSMLLEDFQQEFECSFIDSASSYITLDLIHANTPGMRDGDRDDSLMGADLSDDGIEEEKELEIQVFRTADELLLGYEPEKHGRLFLGYDVARRRDAAVIFITGLLDNGKKRSVAEIEMKNQTFEYQREQIRKIMRSLPVVRGCIDQTGQGEDTTEQLQKEFGKTRLEGIQFNNYSKGVLAIAVRTGLEQREFLLHNDRKFHKQIHSIKRMTSIGGSFRYDAERTKDGHADSFWAWALSNHAVIENKKKKSSFYDQYREKKVGVKLEVKGNNISNNNSVNTNNNISVNKQVIKKGKTYAQLMRSWDKVGGVR